MKPLTMYVECETLLTFSQYGEAIMTKGQHTYTLFEKLPCKMSQTKTKS